MEGFTRAPLVFFPPKYMLTIDMLKVMPPHTVFATGTAFDNPEGINMTGSGAGLRWVAVRGGIHDWALYIHYQEHDIEWITREGDKVHFDDHIKKLVPSDEEAFKMYRH